MSYRLTKAGKFSIALSLAGVTGTTPYEGACSPAGTAANKCVVSDAETSIVAGQPAKLRITRFDRCAPLSQAAAH